MIAAPVASIFEPVTVAPELPEEATNPPELGN